MKDREDSNMPNKQDRPYIQPQMEKHEPLRVVGTPGYTSSTPDSDRRLKVLGQHFDAGLDAISELDPIRYKYRSDNPLGLDSNTEHVGIVAQDLRLVLPDAVSTGDKGYLRVNYDPIIWAMVNAIKELKRQNEALAEQSQRLAQQLDDILATAL